MNANCAGLPGGLSGAKASVDLLRSLTSPLHYVNTDYSVVGCLRSAGLKTVPKDLDLL